MGSMGVRMIPCRRSASPLQQWGRWVRGKSEKCVSEVCQWVVWVGVGVWTPSSSSNMCSNADPVAAVPAERASASRTVAGLQRL